MQPTIDTTNRCIFANGNPITIEMKDKKTIASWDGGSYIVGSMWSVYGGVCVKDGEEQIDLDSTSICMKSGNIKYLWGGSVGASNIKKVEIVLLGGICSGVSAGSSPGAADWKPQLTNYTDVKIPHHIGKSVIKVRGAKVQIAYGGGGAGIADVDDATLEFSGISCMYATAASSNGTTRKSKMIISGGKVTEAACTNRGTAGPSEMAVTGGTITRIYSKGDDAGVASTNNIVLTGGKVTTKIAESKAKVGQPMEHTTISAKPGIIADSIDIKVLGSVIIDEKVGGTYAMVKRCKVIPKGNHYQRWISGVLANREKITLPAELDLTTHEIARCVALADVYEVVDGGHVLLDNHNYAKDNSGVATQESKGLEVPKVDYVYPRGKKTEEKKPVSSDTKKDTVSSTTTATDTK